MSVLTIARVALFCRPAEVHFKSFEAPRRDAAEQNERCKTLDAKDDRILLSDDGASVHFRDATPRLTHYALGQLASMAKVAMPVLECLDGETRAKVMKRCLPRNRRCRTTLVDGDRLRAVTSDRCERVWDADVNEQVDRWLLPSGSTPAMPTRPRRREGAIGAVERRLDGDVAGAVGERLARYGAVSSGKIVRGSCPAGELPLAD